MEKQLVTKGRGKNTPKGALSNKQGTDAQAFSIEVRSLLDIFARIELRHQGKRYVSKGVR